MGKKILDVDIDAMLAQVEGDAVHVCSAEPLTYAEASSTYQLATEAITSANYTKANGDTSGRKNTCAPGAGSTIDNSGTANHVAVTVGTTLKLVTTCSSQALTAGGTVDVGSFDHEIQDVA